MLKNYFKIATRNLIKNKGYSTINILGLSLGITCCLILFIIVRFELSFDNFHPHADRIYRVVTDFTRPEGLSYSSGASTPMHKALQNEMPDLEQIAIVRHEDEGNVVLLKDEQKKFKEENIGFVNQHYFNIFQYNWLTGNKNNALKNPGSAAISEELAIKYFNTPDDALGEMIRLNNEHDLKVTGVFEDYPENSDFKFSVLASYATVQKEMEEVGEWGSVSSNVQHYILLPENVKSGVISQRLEGLKHKYLDKGDAKKTDFSLQPLNTIHFDSRYGTFSDRVIGKETIWALMAIGIFMIVTACINFVNLSTAQAVKRSKEVGVRKVLGSSKFQISSQFLGETSIITFIAIVISIRLVEASLPYIVQLMELKLSFEPVNDVFITLFLFGLFVSVSFLSGFYPAIVLADFKPVEAIKNRVGTKYSGGLNLRRSLVVAQFVISQILIIGTIIVTSQLEYFKSKDLGFNKEAIIIAPLPDNENASLAKLGDKLNNINQVQNFTFSLSSPSSDSRWVSGMEMMGSEVEEVYADIKMADLSYPETYGIELVAGRFYKESDSIREIVVNETFIRKYGIDDPADAIGREVKFWTEYPVPIVGVIKDFHANSLRDEIGPLIISTSQEDYEEAGIKIAPSNINQTLEAIEAAWSEVYPAYVFDYQFLDERIGAFYEREAVLGKLFKIFAAIAIFIGCLGLYGLVSFMAAQKTKEIGIRKILGASVSNILLVFSREFTILVLFAFAIAAPISYYLMKSWLQDFTYKIEIGVGVFLLAIVSSLLVAWLTVGYKAIKAAIANPINALKSE